jgi:hypothetical protein
MYSDADFETYTERLHSEDAATRAMAADDATDGVSDWGQHSYTTSQAHRLSRALVDALAVESDPVARESILNALGSLITWDLAPEEQVARAVSLPRPDPDPLSQYWEDIEAGSHQRERPSGRSAP